MNEEAKTDRIESVGEMALKIIANFYREWEVAARENKSLKLALAEVDTAKVKGPHLHQQTHLESLELKIAAMDEAITSRNARHVADLKDINALKEVCDQQLKWGNELKTRCDQQRIGIENLQNKLGELKSNGPYKRGYLDGYTEALAKVQENVLKLRQ